MQHILYNLIVLDLVSEMKLFYKDINIKFLSKGNTCDNF
jgi:hypothetical protein